MTSQGVGPLRIDRVHVDLEWKYHNCSYIGASFILCAHWKLSWIHWADKATQRLYLAFWFHAQAVPEILSWRERISNLDFVLRTVEWESEWKWVSVQKYYEGRECAIKRHNFSRKLESLGKCERLLYAPFAPLDPIIDVFGRMHLYVVMSIGLWNRRVFFFEFSCSV